ncbi:YbaB/EbfC family nucleoid-associated protein [Kutzneria buriramensis]|uniref:DNA-binding protein YbaB n=1 Tax=Kutzneria buriramensis TaxID=1045776 RepID=A0A3E0I9D4_9PSEU|nr:YbaB/EbfC family nucleoid-associated protein [Kutzneria buriramensis]REH55267.1 DNA-binding protein YbaB [Kutzneria buriramensis]
MTDSEQMAELLARNAALLDSMSQLLDSSRQQLAHAQQLNRDLRTRTTMAQSPDRMVTVVVDGVGGLRQLSFDRDAFEHHTPASLAEAVARAVREAARQVGAAPLEDAELPAPEPTPEPVDPLDPDPLGVDPLAVAPLGSDPLGGDPLISDPLGGDPRGSESLSRDLVAEDRPGLDPLDLDEPPAPVEPILDPEPVPVPVLIQDPPAPAPDRPADSGSQIDHVVTALSKLPSYAGIVTRVLGVRDPDRAAAIAAEYHLGDTIVERTFLSTSANPAYTGDGLVRYTIDARHGGKLIGAISQDGEQFAEVVFGPGSTFRVTGKRYYPSIKGWDIALEELG